jgi:hypothetical protein
MTTSMPMRMRRRRNASKAIILKGTLSMQTTRDDEFHRVSPPIAPDTPAIGQRARARAESPGAGRISQAAPQGKEKTETPHPGLLEIKRFGARKSPSSQQGRIFWGKVRARRRWAYCGTAGKVIAMTRSASLVFDSLLLFYFCFSLQLRQPAELGRNSQKGSVACRTSPETETGRELGVA